MIAFTFPGQGSQHPGFGSAWVNHPSWELVAEASHAAGRDISALLLDAEADELRETRNAQLSTYVASLVVLDAVERLGIEPQMVAGHSLGEYSALTAAGVMAFDEGVHLVVERGNAMQAADDERPGTMRVLLGLDEEQVAVACARVADEVWAANFNGPGNTVIAGTTDAVDEATEIARELGASKVLDVAVGGAFHTPLMAGARPRLEKALREVELRKPTTPVVANVDASVHTGAAEWSRLLTAQLCSPVRWRQTLATLQDEGVHTFIELGPGTVLTGLAKRGALGARTLSLSTPGGLDSLVELLAGPVAHHDIVGERPHLAERLLVSPVAGVFHRSPQVGDSTMVAPGDEVGRVSGHPVRSAFGGRLMSFLAIEGERVTPRQPVAWLLDGSLA